MRNYTYCLYLITPTGREVILTGVKDPSEIHRVAAGRSFTRRASKFGCSMEITKDNKVIKFQSLERICLDRWFEEREGDNEL